MSEWINVDLIDLLPETGRYVLGSIENLSLYPKKIKYVDVCRLNSDISKRWWSDRLAMRVNVTHWMPCPEPANDDNL